MKSTTVAVLALSVLGIYAEPANVSEEIPLHATTNSSKPALFDVLILSVRTRPASPSQELSWTIRGLWPAWSNGVNGPEYCETKTLSKTDLAPIRLLLKQVWPTFDSRTNGDLWQEAFAKHGSCIVAYLEELKSPFDYFQLTTLLFAAYHVQTWLEEANIRPSNAAPLDIANLRKAIAEKFPDGDFGLDCEGRQNNSDILKEIRLCLSHNLYRPTQCDVQGNTCQTGHVWYKK